MIAGVAHKNEGKNAMISLAKGGKAINVIGEIFQPNLFTGTSVFSMPIATTSRRDGFGSCLVSNIALALGRVISAVLIAVVIGRGNG